MRRGGWLIAAFAAGCGSSDPVAVQVRIERGCEGAACTVEADGSGLLMLSADPRGDDVTRREGEYALYAEASLPDGGTAVIELGFDRGDLARARYREVTGSRVITFGPATELFGRSPRPDPEVPVAGHFAFTVQGEDGRRRVSGSIIPANGETVRVEAGSADYVATDSTVGCDGAVYIPSPVIVDDPADPPVSGPPSYPEPEPEPEPYDEWSSEPPPPPKSSGGGCEGDDYEAPSTDENSGGGCEGDDYEAPSTGESSGGGCEGDDYEAPSTGESSGGGCEGDAYDDSTSSGENDAGCEGDAAMAATVLPYSPRILGSLWRLVWPFAVCGVMNRRSRRRGARPAAGACRS